MMANNYDFIIKAKQDLGLKCEDIIKINNEWQKVYMIKFSVDKDGTLFFWM
jgi:hypothetical protein